MRRLALPLSLAAAGIAMLAFRAGRRREAARLAHLVIERDRSLGIRPGCVRSALSGEACRAAEMGAHAEAARPTESALKDAAIREAGAPKVRGSGATPDIHSSLPVDPYIMRLGLERRRRQMRSEAEALEGDTDLSDGRSSSKVSAAEPDGLIASSDAWRRRTSAKLRRGLDRIAREALADVSHASTDRPAAVRTTASRSVDAGSTGGTPAGPGGAP